ncbi:MAG TPA: CDP-alcohol phosphatidyltransferase family protein [Chthoniobacterales bacterium]|nr:CDP-alcohol phosphatidyltransferase family protein [Chthoniobacterales bacterium]
MAAQLAQPVALETTYKVREAEGILDIYFYRKIGFQLAKFFAKVGMSPTEVTLVGGLFGVMAGHLYFYQAVGINLAGMILHVVANAFDNADGQLARLTNQQSRTGRILDPVVDHIVWLSIYVHLALRLNLSGFPGTVWLLALVAGLSHGLQAGSADYWRNAYLYFGKGGNNFDTVSNLRTEYGKYSWRAEPWRKFLLRLYLNATHQQELLMPGVTKLRESIGQGRAPEMGFDFQSRYTALARPTFKWWSLLMTNTRMLVLFVLFLVKQPVWFFWIEIIAGNLLLVYLIARQEKISRSFVQSPGLRTESA